MDWTLFRGFIYFFVLAVGCVWLVSYICYLYANKARSAHYEEYSNLVLNDSLDDKPLEAREDRANGSKEPNKG
ncbi:MAG: CcoQ/FixQ family Cbb3-type cytochrome c oxidase assembly chaperone [Helicobacteraceae bacterium]|nr:CcoQ/FixQ family Cbb3-type cytochrome c oxidase assembly chaperone [Helicobacteraceae bacterium]